MSPPAHRLLVRALAVALAALALYPLAQIGRAWVEYTGTVGLGLEESPPRGFDGVRWEDAAPPTASGAVRAAYVFPRGPAAAAGLREGDRLLTLDLRPVASAASVERDVERATGAVLAYGVERGGVERALDVRVERYPTFLYPVQGRLWAAAGWGFAVAAFLHLLAYLTVAPLAPRSPRARRSQLLIGAALVWVAGNLVRLLWVEVWGPPPAGPASGGAALAGVAFDALTLAALGGWIAYPLLLLDQGIRSSRQAAGLGAGRWVLVVPAAVLGVGVTLATVVGHVGPLPPDAFAIPILFYVCVYVAAATALSFGRPAAAPPDAAPPPRWSRAGSAFVFALSVAGAALVAARVAPGPQDVPTAWFVVAFQLFSLLPVALVSLSTLRYGQFDVLLLRGLSAVAVLAGAFVAVSLGSLALDAVLPGGSHPVALGVLVVVLLLVAERTAPMVREQVQRAFRTERQRARRRLDRLGDRIRFAVDVDALAAETVESVGRALGARSAVVFLLAGAGTPAERWVRARFRPEAPTFEEADLEQVWARVRDEGRVWSWNEELNESALPRGYAERLDRLGAALAVPVTTGQGGAVGLVVLGRKARRFTVYNTEDVDRLKALAGGLALAVERLRLLERERALVRQTAEAELATLRAQINPHFLFNALNTVAALIGERPDEAERTVEHLAGLFRDVLTASGRALVPLRDELRLVRRYLAVEKARFGDAIEVEVDVEAGAADAEVPAFAVQTLVENAVKHGVEQKRGGGRVSVRARVEGGALVVDVRDTGAGLAVAPPPAGGADAGGAAGDGAAADPTAFYGVGLRNVSDRLRQLYGDGARLTLAPRDPGTLASLVVPLAPPRPDAPPAAPPEAPGANEDANGRGGAVGDVLAPVSPRVVP
ncbi:histidine kinase [Rubrivirga sp. S365]|uniref:Histidine kinase n=1 Tax=Rubrivirga litoralis TaxID=3075598 RepID=A0ABU3BTH8_9BACT|nr:MULTISPECIES: histidine kinase [unclassified Rubrivirga]MDT0632573.1 histidine kinase [Rubrivirga sp. F394]MDT7856737.1 histidine kinase [Rubrivirga sp. S365]